MRKIYKPAVIVTAVMLSLTACGGKEEPVVSETAIEEPAVSEMATDEPEKSSEPEESREDTTPSETESPAGEESPEDIESEAETTQEEEIAENQSESDLGYEIIPMDDTTMYCTGNSANIRKGPNTEYEKVGTLSYAQEIVVNGKVETADSTWYVIKTGNEEIEMVSSSLLSATKPVQQSSTGGTGNTGNTSESAGTQRQPPATDNNEASNVPGSIGFGGVPVTPGNDGSGAGGTDINWQ